MTQTLGRERDDIRVIDLLLRECDGLFGRNRKRVI